MDDEDLYYEGYPVDETEGNLFSDWADASVESPGWLESRGKVAWILANSPLVACWGKGLVDNFYYQCLSNYMKDAGSAIEPKYFADNDGAGEIASAMQAAIWHFTDGRSLDLRDMGNDGNTKLQRALYSYLLDNAQDMDTLDFDRHTIIGSAGSKLGPIMFTSATAAELVADLPQGFALVHDDDSAVDCSAPGGTPFFLRVPADADAGTLTLTARSTVALPVGRVWTSQTGAALVTTLPTDATLTATATFSWTGASLATTPPEPTETSTSEPTPAGTDSTTPPSPTPSVPPTTPRATTTPEATTTQVPSPAPPAPPHQSEPTPSREATPTHPEPTPTTTPKPTQVPTPAPTQAPTTQRTFQVDRYLPTAAAQARMLARLDDDGVLRYREDRSLWRSSRWQFVTVRVPATATTAQIMKAVNAATSPRIGDVRTTNRLARARVGTPVTIVWELGRGAAPASPWGPKNPTSQTFLARS